MAPTRRSNLHRILNNCNGTAPEQRRRDESRRRFGTFRAWLWTDGDSANRERCGGLAGYRRRGTDNGRFSKSGHQKVAQTPPASPDPLADISASRTTTIKSEPPIGAQASRRGTIEFARRRNHRQPAPPLPLLEDNNDRLRRQSPRNCLSLSRTGSPGIAAVALSRSDVQRHSGDHISAVATHPGYMTHIIFAAQTLQPRKPTDFFLERRAISAPGKCHRYIGATTTSSRTAHHHRRDQPAPPSVSQRGRSTLQRGGRKSDGYGINLCLDWIRDFSHDLRRKKTSVISSLQNWGRFRRGAGSRWQNP